jgi:hypothetical protein
VEEESEKKAIVSPNGDKDGKGNTNAIVVSLNNEKGGNTVIVQ